MAQKYKQLHFVTLQSLVNWSVAYLIKNNTLTSTFPTVSIGTFLKRNKTVIDVLDNVRYKRVTIKTMGGGVFLRDEQEGKNIGTKKQFIVKEGQFIVSKIDARNGAFGVVPKVANNAIITGNFWTFDVNLHYILPEYLALLTSTKEFMQFAEKASNGTTNRHYLQESLFLSQKIPLPSLEEQYKIIAAYNATIAQAKQYSTQAKDIDKQIEKHLQDELGLLKTSVSKKQNIVGKFIKLVHLKDITRWDIYNLQNGDYNGKYNSQFLRDILISTPKYGAGYKAEKKHSDVRYIRITDINEDGSLNDDFVSVSQYDNQYLLKQNDFLIARTGNTVGKTFLYDESMGKAIYAGYLIKFELNTKKVNPQYLLAYTKSSIYKQWIKSNMRISAQPNINCKQYEESPIILPPLNIQNKIVEHITALRKKQKDLQQKSLTLRQQATQKFEQTIFN